MLNLFTVSSVSEGKTLLVDIKDKTCKFLGESPLLLRRAGRHDGVYQGQRTEAADAQRPGGHAGRGRPGEGGRRGGEARPGLHHPLSGTQFNRKFQLQDLYFLWVFCIQKLSVRDIFSVQTFSYFFVQNNLNFLFNFP